MIGHGLLAFRQAADAFDACQLLAVAGVDGSAALQDMRHVFELQEAKGSVDFAHLGVDAGGDDGDLIDKTKVLQMVDALLGLGVGADDGAALEGVEDLGGMKAEHRQVAMAQHAAVGVLHGKDVGGIINHAQVVVVGNFLDGSRVAGVAVAVHRHDGGGVRGDGGLDLGRVEVEGVRLHIYKHGLAAVPQERVRGGDKGVRRGDDLAGDAQGLQRGDEGQGAVAE